MLERAKFSYGKIFLLGFGSFGFSLIWSAIVGPNVNGWIFQLLGRNYNLIMAAAPGFMAVALAMMWGVRRGEARAEPV